MRREKEINKDLSRERTVANTNHLKSLVKGGKRNPVGPTGLTPITGLAEFGSASSPEGKRSNRPTDTSIVILLGGPDLILLLGLPAGLIETGREVHLWDENFRLNIKPPHALVAPRTKED